jgi:molecular chaperone IbpA
MNTRRVNLDLLNDPLFIGFDTIFNKLDQIGKTHTTNYPPYNLIKTGEDTYLIEIAVAGFDEEDFDIELHDGVLTINATTESDETTQYLHKGIAARGFTRRFTLADTIEVEGVSLHQGMLTIRLRNIIPDEKKPKKIFINKEAKQEFLVE